MTAELFPTPARGIATAAITTAGKIGSIVSPYISNLVYQLFKITYSL